MPHSFSQTVDVCLASGDVAIDCRHDSCFDWPAVLEWSKIDLARTALSTPWAVERDAFRSQLTSLFHTFLSLFWSFARVIC